MMQTIYYKNEFVLLKQCANMNIGTYTCNKYLWKECTVRVLKRHKRSFNIVHSL